MIEYVHPEDRIELFEYLRKSFGEKRNFQIELRFRKKDGNYVYTENHGVWLKDDNGEINRIIGVIKNITERKIAIEKIEESERNYRSVIQNFHGIVFQRDENFVPVFLHGAVEEITGYREEEFTSKIKFKDIIHPDDLSLVLKEEEKIQSFPSIGYGEIEYRIKNRDGRIKWVNEVYQKIKTKDGKPEFYQGAIYDVTESKKAEENLRSSNIYNRSLIEASLDPLVTIGPDGKITDVNGATEQVTGYSRNELIGTDFSDYFTEPEKASTGYQQVFTHGKVRDYSLEIQHKDGHITPVLYNASVYKAENGKVIGVFAAARDITESKKAEEALANIEIARKQEIHHRIKNNLQVISSLLDLQAEKFEDNEVLEAFRESQNRVISMSLIHEELYKGKGTDTLDFSAYLQKLAENLFQTYNLRNKNISLYMDLEEKAFFDMDIAVPLGIIVNELVSNSLKYAFAEDEGEIRIRLCREEKNSKMNESLFSLTVLDNGKGIPENIELESVESLGLQLVGILVDQLDGKIELKREHGTGFRITFNVAEDHNPE